MVVKEMHTSDIQFCLGPANPLVSSEFIAFVATRSWKIGRGKAAELPHSSVFEEPVLYGCLMGCGSSSASLVGDLEHAISIQLRTADHTVGSGCLADSLMSCKEKPPFLSCS